MSKIILSVVVPSRRYHPLQFISLSPSSEAGDRRNNYQCLSSGISSGTAKNTTGIAQNNKRITKSKYIDKLDEEGSYISNLDYSYSATLELKSLKQKQPRFKTTSFQRVSYGATYLLQEIAEKTGIRENLQKTFPDNYRHVLSLPNYLVMESDSPIYRLSLRGVKHWHPYGQEIGSHRISEFFLP